MKTIVRRSLAIGTFLGLLGLNATLSQPQLRHLERFADLVAVAPRRKTLARLAELELDGVDPSNLADFFRISPWAPMTSASHCWRSSCSFSTSTPSCLPCPFTSLWMIL